MEPDYALFLQAQSWQSVWRTLIIILWFSDLLSEEGAYFTNDNFPCHISFFVYTFCRLLDFSQKLYMTFQDFYNKQSGLNVTAELFKYGLFWKINYQIISVSIETSAKYR